MSTRAEIKDALTSIDRELSELRDQIIANEQTPLREGDWKVWDVLCHLAARSTSVEMIRGRLERAQAGGEQERRDVTRNIDEINQAQIDERQGRSAAELLDEIARGHEASRQLLDAMDDGLLEGEFPSFRGDGMVPGAQLILQASAGHDRMHLQQIRDAL